MKKLFLLVCGIFLSFSLFAADKRKIIKNASPENIEKISDKKNLSLYFSQDKSNALQVAIQEHNFIVAEWFVENEICDVNHFNVYGRTAVNDAIEAFDTGLLGLLVKKGACIRREKFFKDPIVQTVEVANLDAAKYFCDMGYGYDFITEDGRNMIHVASDFSKPEMLPFLIEKGCFVDKVDKNDLTPLLLAIKNDDTVMLAALLEKGADIEKKSAGNQTPLFYSIEKFANESFMYLLDKNVNIEWKDSKNRSPFLYAYEVDNENAAAVLIKKGVSFPKDQVLKALKDQKYFYLDLLIDAGADLSLTDAEKKNILHIAAEKSDYNSLVLFLKYPASRKIINDKDKNSSTPLLLACKNGSGFVNGVRDLIIAGADPSISDKYKKNALHAAMENNTDADSMALGRLIIDRDGSLLNTVDSYGQTPLIIALKLSKSECASYLMGLDVDVKVKDVSGNTALHYAASNGMNEAAKNIVARGGLVNAVNGKQETALTIAAKKENVDLSDYFLSLTGVNVDIPDSSGKSARTYLFDFYSKVLAESSKREEKYSSAQKEAELKVKEAEISKRDCEYEIRLLEAENYRLQKKIDGADEKTDTSSWEKSIKANDASIRDYNSSIRNYNKIIRENESAIRDYKKKIDEEEKLQHSYLERIYILKKISGQ